MEEQQDQESENQMGLLEVQGVGENGQPIVKDTASIAIAAASAKNTHGRHHDLQSNYDAAFWNDFGNGFKVGFGGVMDGFGQIAPHIAAAIPGSEEYLVPMAGITQTINQGVQGIPINFF